MNKQVKELVERARLTDEDKVKAQRDYIEKTWQEVKVSLDFPLRGYRREECLLNAQRNKVLYDPDLALIDRERSLPDNPYEEDLYRQPGEEAEYYAGKYNGVEAGKSLMLEAGYLPVIPLADALKEVEE